MNANWFLRKLIPPREKLQEALAHLFAEPRLPLVFVVIHGYGALNWDEYTSKGQALLDIRRSPSMIAQLLFEELGRVPDDVHWELDTPAERERTLNQLKAILAEREEAIRSQINADEVTLREGMVDRDAFDGAITTLHKDWAEFFAKRAVREEELLLSESSKDRQARLQREKKPPIKKCRMFLWSKAATTEGGFVYARTLQRQRDHSTLVETYSKEQTKFYARNGDWDFFEEFDPLEREPYDDLVDPEAEPDPPEIHPTTEECALNPPDPSAEPCAPTPIAERAPTPVAEEDADPIPETFYLKATVEDYSPQSPTPPPQDMDTTEDSETLPGQTCASDTRILERVYWQFGFIPPLGKDYPPVALQWTEVLHMLGHVGDDAVGPSDKLALQAYFSALVRKETIPEDLDDLSENCRSYLLGRIGLGNFSLLGKWFIFWAPRSASTGWFLGVDSAAAVLYILRILGSMGRSHTSLTLGHLLIRNGVRFRTFLRLPRMIHHALKDPFRPAAYRPMGYNFTAQDFEATLLDIRGLLRAIHQGRAALLMGGIIGRIARECLDADEVLDGPSVEATYCRHGLCVDAEDDKHEYWDDDLTENEIATICGTYLMYTGEFILSSVYKVNDFIDNQLIPGSGEQTTKVSWFPPPHAIEGSSYDSVEWTPKAEDLFQKIFTDARRGTFQPLTAKKWRHTFRDLKNPRVAFDNNRLRAEKFLVEQMGENWT